MFTNLGESLPQTPRNEKKGIDVGGEEGRQRTLRTWIEWTNKWGKNKLLCAVQERKGKM